MASGDQSKALRITAQQKGWDPTTMIADVDVAPTPWAPKNDSVGQMVGDTGGQSEMQSRVTWAAPDRANGSDKNRATNIGSGAGHKPGGGAPGAPGGVAGGGGGAPVP